VSAVIVSCGDLPSEEELRTAQPSCPGIFEFVVPDQTLNMIAKVSDRDFSENIEHWVAAMYLDS
jgi:hypothetical protein